MKKMALVKMAARVAGVVVLLCAIAGFLVHESLAESNPVDAVGPAIEATSGVLFDGGGADAQASAEYGDDASREANGTVDENGLNIVGSVCASRASGARD